MTNSDAGRQRVTELEEAEGFFSVETRREESASASSILFYFFHALRLHDRFVRLRAGWRSVCGRSTRKIMAEEAGGSLAGKANANTSKPVD